MTYINPSRKLDRERQVFFKVQIDNFYDLGGKKEDILIFTNFPYKYNGVQSIEVDDNNYCPFRPNSTKTVTIANVFKTGVFKKEEIYWGHDSDAYQQFPITDEELGMEEKDFAASTYGWSPKWQLGMYFFKSSSGDIFEALRDTVYEIHNEDERALVKLTNENYNNINSRINKLNNTYNFSIRHIVKAYAVADKPLKVLHFTPGYVDKTMFAESLQMFMYGKNELGIPFMTKRLIKIFKYHGVE